MSFATVEAQPRAVEALRSALRAHALHHAYLFAGPEGVGKELTAIALAQAVCCTNRSPAADGTAGVDGCGACDACRRVAARTHPDVTFWMPEAEEVDRGLKGRSDFALAPSRDLRVEQIRTLQDRLSLRALESDRKVAIIVSAHAMNVQAQNAFLKTLEEPPAGTLLVLVTSSPDRLLPTLRSRCSTVRFNPLPAALLVRRVQAERQLDAATAELVAQLAEGSLSRALAYDAKGLSARRDTIERFEALDPSDARGWLQFAETLAGGREEAEACLEVLSLWFRDLALAKAGATQLANRDLAELAQRASAMLSEATLHRRVRLLEQTRRAVSERNGSSRLQVEAMLIEMLSGARPETRGSGR